MKKLFALLLAGMLSGWFASGASATTRTVTLVPLEMSITDFAQAFNDHPDCFDLLDTEAAYMPADVSNTTIIPFKNNNSLLIAFQWTTDHSQSNISAITVIQKQSASPDFEKFVAICDLSMQATYKELNAFDRANMLYGTICDGVFEKSFDQNNLRSTLNNGCCVNYVIRPNNERQFILYKSDES